MLKSRWIRIACILIALVFLSWGSASVLMWYHYGVLTTSLRQGDWPFGVGGRQINFQEYGSDGSQGKSYRLSLARDGERVVAGIDVPGQEFFPLRLWKSDAFLYLESQPKERGFWADGDDVVEIRNAVRELAGHAPEWSLAQRLLGSLVLRPFPTGVKWSERGLLWRISTSRGSLWLGRDALPYEADLQIGKWQVQISPYQDTSLPPEAEPAGEVPGGELAAGIAEAIRMAGMWIAPLETKPDEIRTSGAGWLAVRGGHVQMYLEGTPYEIGRQHGRLDPEGVERVCRRLVYGVGLLYSFKKGEWFPNAARKLVERQRPFIAPVYFEEMQGVADGAGLPIDLVQMANIFPEFFHCSGVALLGEATADGELLHARVLDYMVGIGLQDHAAVMAISRPGANRFVTVGYLAFIGSVTGMNEKQVAIGEMGGAGQGDWDGIPMSLLIRQALEDCDTLAEVETFMRKSPRTCEYYYVISDGKGPSAIGVAATPEKFEVFGPGVWHERLTQPVQDAVLLSGQGRYEALVERVRERYGAITREDLIEIIKRPVAMKSNLHNVIFQPQSLRLSVADATQSSPACDQPYRTYLWGELFSIAPSL